MPLLMESMPNRFCLVPTFSSFGIATIRAILYASTARKTWNNFLVVYGIQAAYDDYPMLDVGVC